jgi:SHS2 domain-containing protein
VEREVTIQSSDREALLVDWLNELLYLFDVDRIIFSRFDITELSQNSLKARAYGEKMDISRHKLKTSVKAATYHMLRVDEGKNGVEVQFILDI